MEAISAPGRALAIIDYAHTPDALAKALRAARVHCDGELHVVFGCGGDRDRGKRPMMASVAAELAEKTGMTKKDATGALDEFIGLVVKHLKKGNKVRVTGLGIFQVRARPARMGRNPATGEAIKIKASKKVAFRVAKDLKEAI